MNSEGNKLTILMLVASLPPMAIGGAEMQALKLARRLTKLGHKIVFMTPGDKLVEKNNKLNEFEVYYLNSVFNKVFKAIARIKNKKGHSDTKIEYDDSIEEHNIINRKVSFATVIYYSIFYLHCLYVLKQRKILIDIIHSHTIEWSAIVAARLGKTLRIKVVIKDSTMNGFQSLRRFPNGQIKQKLLIRYSHFVAMTSEIERNLLLNGVPIYKIHKIPNGIELQNEFKSDLSSLNKVLFVGNLYQQPAKGIDILLKAWQIVCRNFDSALLEIAGDGDLQSYKEYVLKLGIFNNVIFYGKVKHIEPLYRSTYVFVLPSRREGMSNALMEAMSYSIPCIATRISGNEDLIQNGINGLLIPPANVQALADAICYLFANRRKAKEFGENGRASILSGFTMEKVADMYSSLYSELIWKEKLK